jgi:hypothetical protein
MNVFAKKVKENQNDVTDDDVRSCVSKTSFKNDLDEYGSKKGCITVYQQLGN